MNVLPAFGNSSNDVDFPYILLSPGVTCVTAIYTDRNGYFKLSFLVEGFCFSLGQFSSFIFLWETPYACFPLACLAC